MLYQVIVAVALIGFALNLVLNLRSLKKPRDSQIPGTVPFVSILIPARDEETNILVLDDSSSDNTRSVVAGIAAKDKRIRLVEGEPLPAGWAGKPFACHQLARQASGDWFLFIDADTIHTASMLRTTMGLALEERASLLSGFPRQLAASLPQKIAIPVLYFVILSWLPLWWLQSSRKPRPSLAIGQFLLFPRGEYRRIGGHEAVKSRILEDVWLGIEVKRHGGRHIAIDLSPVVSCHMYRNIGAMWEGFVKWIYSVATLSSLALVGLLVAGYIFFLAPFYWLWNELFVVTVPTGWGPILIFQVATILAMRWLVDNHFREPFISFLLHPLGFSFLFLACLYAGARRILGAGVQWKARLYSKESSID